MPEFEQDGFKGMWLPGLRLSGEHGMAVIAKRRFRVDTASAECEPADETPDVVQAPEHADPEDPANSPLLKPNEAVLEKPRVDVLVRGTAYAPNKKAAPRFDVRIWIDGALDRRLRILGPRVAHWLPPTKEVSEKKRAEGEQHDYTPPEFSEPEPIEKLPLSYEYAYGGRAPLVMDEFTQELAQDQQEQGKQQQQRRERKKEIEKELEQQAGGGGESGGGGGGEGGDAGGGGEAAAAAGAAGAAAAGAAAAGAASRRRGPKTPDERAAEVFAEDEAPRDEDGTKVLDPEAAAAEASGEEEMVADSAFRFRDPEEVRDRDVAGDQGPSEEAEAADESGEEASSDEGEESSDEGGEGGEDDDASAFSEGTGVIDTSEAGPGDELADVLAERDVEQKQRVRDGEGTVMYRTSEMGDVALADDAWIEEHGGVRQEPEEQPAEESPHPQMPYPANPVGRGFCVSHEEDAVEGLPLPSIEDPQRPLEPEDVVQDPSTMKLEELPPVPGVAPYSGSWYPRAALAGVMPWDLDEAEKAKQEALKEYDPDDPDDQPAIEAIENQKTPVMQADWYQAAHPDMQVAWVRGDEEVRLEHLTPDGVLYFKLPGLHPTATVDLGEGPHSVTMHLDTVTFDVEDPDAPAVELIWRGWHRLRDLQDLEDAQRIDVRLWGIDQEAWLEAQRQAATQPEGEGGTQVMQAVDDDEGPMGGEEAEQRYKEEVAAHHEGPEVGEKQGEDDLAVVDDEQERKLYEDWEEPYKSDELTEEAQRQKEEAEEARKKAIRKQAREQADEEFGIDRDEE